MKMFLGLVGMLCCSASCFGTTMNVSCNSLMCGDVVADYYVDGRDYDCIMGVMGERMVLDKSCAEGSFSENGYTDTNDTLAWDWRLDEDEALTLCGWDLYEEFMSSVMGGGPQTLSITTGAGYGNSLLLSGNIRDNSGNFSMDNGLVIYNAGGSYVGNPFTLTDTRSNGRLVCDADGAIYQLNTKIGLINRNEGVAVVTAGRFLIDEDPRYGDEALVCIGIQRNTTESGTAYGGRPIMDVAIDADGYVYVVPVVVVPSANTSLTYLAAAKLQLNSGQTPCYSIVRLYDDPPAEDDENDPYRYGLSEIEVDNSGNVFITNAHYDYETNISSDFLWVYPANNGSPTKVNLDTLSGVTGGIPDPAGLFASKKNSMVYLASGVNSPEATSVNVYGLSTTNLSLTLSRTIQVNNMGHVTAMAEDPISGAVWVAGFKMVNIPTVPDTSVAPFYHACLVQIPTSSNSAVQATCLDSSSSLAMPFSMTWMPSNLINSDPVDQHYWWRYGKNICRLTFDGNITTPTSGSVLIQQMQNGGAYGADLSSNFTFTVENDANGNPRILRIFENTQCLTNQNWYAIRNTGSWAGVARFTVQYPLQMGDANDDGQVTPPDETYVITGVITFNCADNDRRDINGDGKIMPADLSAMYLFYPSTTVTKPSGH